MLIGSIFVGAVVMCLLQHVHSADSSPAGSVAKLPGYMYHTFAALLGGDEYDLYHSPIFGRIYRLGLLFLVLITSATYTANLAAYLTKKPYRIEGPRSLEDLKKWPKPVCYR
jgi:hypothetical protein